MVKLSQSLRKSWNRLKTVIAKAEPSPRTPVLGNREPVDRSRLKSLSKPLSQHDQLITTVIGKLKMIEQFEEQLIEKRRDVSKELRAAKGEYDKYDKKGPPLGGQTSFHLAKMKGLLGCDLASARCRLSFIDDALKNMGSISTAKKKAG